jgi:hypothetical protein
MLAIGRFLLVAARLLTGLLDYLRNRQYEAAGKAEAEAQSLGKQLERAEKARTARRAIDARRMPDHDRFRRD